MTIWDRNVSSLSSLDSSSPSTHLRAALNTERPPQKVKGVKQIFYTRRNPGHTSVEKFTVFLEVFKKKKKSKIATLKGLDGHVKLEKLNSKHAV